LSGFRDAFESLAMTRKNFDAQFFFQFYDRFGHAWLRGVQGLGGFRQVEVSPSGLLDEAELVQIHVLFVMF
jgi:hypothetical protein